MNDHPDAFKWPITHPVGAVKGRGVKFMKGFPDHMTCFKIRRIIAHE